MCTNSITKYICTTKLDTKINHCLIIDLDVIHYKVCVYVYRKTSNLN